jgi:hypothetical protein
MLALLITAFITILVGVTLAPTVANEVWIAKYNGTGGAPGNISGASATVLNLVTLFYCLGVASVAIGTAVVALRKGGMF